MDKIYLQKIKTQSNNITRLRNRAQQLQINLDKATIVNQEKNKRDLQQYVDNQARNIELVADRLEKDKNSIDANITVPVDTLNKIIKIVNNLPNLTRETKRDLTDKIIKNATSHNSGIISRDQYNANLNRILQSCPQYDLSGLVKKSTVADNCYGCGTP